VQDQATGLVRWLGDAGVEAVLVGPGLDGPEGSVLLGATTVIPVNRSTAPIKLDPRVGAEVRNAVKGFDVVHVHEPLVPFVGTAALRTKERATVATFHADPPGWVRGAYRIGAIGIRAALHHVDVVTAVSPIAGSPIDGIVDFRIVPNGIDVADYDIGPKTPNRVTFLGRDDSRKGLSVLLEAWPRVRRAVPGASLHVLGAARDESIDGASFLGRVSEVEKRAELAGSVVHVAPNLGAESFGIVVLEAMASGCAVVASDIPAFDFVAGGTALLVPPGDAVQLADRVVELLEQPDLASSMGASARKRSLAFGGSSVAAQYLAAYEDALG
jgi:phosphatidylinositol alpha-mannosyltransferase